MSKNLKKKTHNNSMLPMQGAQVQSLFQKRRSHVLLDRDQTNKQKNSFNSSRGEEACNLKLGKQYLSKP